MKAIIITVRTGSTRLPNKCLLKINGITTIEHLINRIKKSKKADLIILCTSTYKQDDILCEIATNNNINYFRGSAKDKLERWNDACKKYKVDFFVTADGDDLFCDPDLIDLAINGDSDAIKLMMKWSFNNSKKFIGGNPIEKIIQSPRDIRDILAVDLVACNNYKNGSDAAKSIECPTMLIFGSG